MPFVGVRELKTKTSEILRTLREEKREYIVTYKGKPCGMLIPLSEEEVEDYILAHHPRYVKMRKIAREEIKKGQIVGANELKALK